MHCPQAVRLVIFDLDGTLIDAYPAIIESFNYTMDACGYARRRPAVIKAAVGWGDRNLLKPFVRAADLDKALQLYRRHHRRSLVHRSRLYPGVRLLLRWLEARGLKLAVATNRPTRFSHILLRHLRIKDMFDTVLCGDAIGHIKPHPQILRMIMRRLKVSPDQTLFAGDMTIDVQTGKRAGVFTVAVTSGSSSRRQLAAEKPDRILPAIRQLRRLLSA